MRCLTGVFATSRMLLVGEHLLIGLPKVRVAVPVLIGRWDPSHNLRQVCALRSPMTKATTWRVARAKAIQTQRLLTRLKTNDQSSSNSSAVALGSCGSGATSISLKGGSVASFF